MNARPSPATEPPGHARTAPVAAGSTDDPVLHDATHTRYHGVVRFRVFRVSVAKNGFVMLNTWAWLVVAVVAVLAAMFVLRPAAAETALTVGAPAPDFALPDAHGQERRLADFRGEWLLLYFYPKDDTPGCTREACAFRDGYAELRARGVQVVGVSLDDAASHRAFAQKYRLPFPLLSDAGGTVAQRYGALWSLGPVRFAKRHSVLIDPQGRVARLYRDVDVDRHFREVLDALAALTPGPGGTPP